MRRSRYAAVDFAGAGALRDSSAGSEDDVRFQVGPRVTSPLLFLRLRLRR